MRFAALLVTTGLLVTVVLSACSGGSSTNVHASVPDVRHVATTPARTVVHTFTPYRADGTPAVASARTESGYCWDSSLAASGPTAFRCFVAAGDGGSAQILDPCFAPSTPDPVTVICVDDPWSRATTLNLTRALPRPVTGAVERPWAIELADGARCVAATGTVPTVRGTNLPYHCTGGTAAALTGTGIDTACWTAVQARPDATVLERTTVAGAWRT